MQATATLNPSNRRKLIPLAAALGLAAVLAVTALVNWNSGSGSDAAERPAVSAASQAAVDARFRAINELPESVSAARPAITNHRFLDMNLLPEAAIADGILSGQALIQFLEWNLVMPGSDADGYYPEIARDGRPT